MGAKKTAVRPNFNGWTTWLEQEERGAVRDAIVTPTRIAFDTFAGDYRYTIELVPAPQGPPWWRGGWRCSTDQTRDYADARLYSSSDGGIVLVGRWVEDGDWTWVTELRPSSPMA
jgi:hypothetical protein